MRIGEVRLTGGSTHGVLGLLSCMSKKSRGRFYKNHSLVVFGLVLIVLLRSREPLFDEFANPPPNRPLLPYSITHLHQ